MGAHQVIVLAGWKTQCFKKLFYLHFALIGRILICTDHLQFCQSIVDGIIFEVTLHIEFFFLFLGIIEFFIAIEYGIFEGKIFKGILILSQHPQLGTRLDLHFTACRLQLSGEYLHESRFTCTVGTDQSISFSLIECDRDLIKEYSFAIPLC